MNKQATKAPWQSPVLEEIPIRDTASKGLEANEGGQRQIKNGQQAAS